MKCEQWFNCCVLFCHMVDILLSEYCLTTEIVACQSTISLLLIDVLIDVCNTVLESPLVLPCLFCVGCHCYCVYVLCVLCCSVG